MNGMALPLKTVPSNSLAQTKQNIGRTHDDNSKNDDDDDDDKRREEKDSPKI